MSSIVPNGGTIGMQLSVREPPPDAAPYQIQSYITPEAWQARMRAVLRKGSRYCRPAFDYAWLLISFLAGLIVPIVIYFVALNALPKGKPNTDDDFWPYGWDDDGRYWKARMISVATLVAIVLVTFLPMLGWKLYGKKRVNSMLQKFEVEDRAVREPGAPVPTYRISMPGIGSSALNLVITVPHKPITASFQPGVQLPPYVVNPPADPAATGAYTYHNQGYGSTQAYDQSYDTGYGQGHGQYNVPLKSVPLYNEFDEKVPAYTGPAGAAYQSMDEKVGFEDVKV
ncbi:hypothetical protein B0H21DRAFT_761553 [Amylocystis lapponica]|nr:hypothetical protein B0H21DRAFT_761553 [Amylocystis lapponica]